MTSFTLKGTRMKRTVVSLMLLLAGFSANATISQDGDGVYLISTYQDLLDFADIVNGTHDSNNNVVKAGTPSANARLEADIVANESLYDSKGVLSTDLIEWSVPIGGYNVFSNYAGTFDGNFHSISGLYNTQSYYSGLFGTLNKKAVVKNLGVINAYITGSSVSQAGGTGASGIICAVNNGTIQNCYSTGYVYSDAYSGGICGQNTGTVTSCYSASQVAGTSKKGGVSATNSGTITYCYYNSDTYTSTDAIAGVTGKSLSDFGTGEVAYWLQNTQSEKVWGQSIGQDEYPLFHGTVVYRTVDCDTVSTYTNNATSDYDMTLVFNNGIPLCPNGNYQQPEFDEANNVYKISNAGELYWFASFVNEQKNYSANAVLTADITVNENVLDENGYLNTNSVADFRNWTPISNYKGVFDGQRHVIKGIYSSTNTSYAGGIFDKVEENGKVQNLGLEDSYMKGINYSGGIVGYNSGGSISNCYSSAHIECYKTVATFIGSVCGYNIGSGSIDHCYGNGRLGDASTLGGIVGRNFNGTISSCYYDSTRIAGAKSVDGALGKPTSSFSSGEVTYLLQKDQEDQVWGQEIGKDTVPVFGDKIVRRSISCTDTSYSNTLTEDVDVRSTFDENGFSICSGYYQQPEYDEVNKVYKIANAGELYWFASLVNKGNDSANAVLTADITVNENVLDADGELNENADEFREWLPISYYKGVFDGNYHVIKGLYCLGLYSNSGVFGPLNTGHIQNLGVEDSYMYGEMYAAGICSHNINGTISNCYSSASVTSVSSGWFHTRIGCICGYNYKGTIDHCYGYGTVGIAENFGGVVGLSNQGTVTSCYYDSTKIPNMQAIDGVSGLPTASFKSGEVAYLLQKGQISDVWGQEIGKDTVPVFGGMKVYQYFDKDSAMYTNDADLDGSCLEHDFSKKVLTDEPNEKGLYAYVCANNAEHITNYNVIKAYNGTDNLELDSTAEGEYYVENLALRDTESFNSPVDFTANTFSYDRKPAAEIVTFMLPIDVPSGSLNGNAYYLKQFDGSTLKFKGTDDIKANTPYMVKGANKGELLISDLSNVTVKATTSINETTVGNATQFGSYVSTTIDNDADYDYYGYSGGKFFRGKVGVSVAPFRTAVKLAKATSAVGNGKPHMSPSELNIEFDDDEATGVEITPAEIGLSGKVSVFDALGRAVRLNVDAEGCLDGLQNGIYIVNGKKVVVSNH